MSILSGKTRNNNSFLDRLTIRKRLILMVSASSLIILALISVVFTIKLYNSFYSARESQMKIATDNMAQTISYYTDKVKKGELTNSEAKKQVVGIINKTRFFDKRGYFFVYDLNGICITVPIKPAITGKNRLESKDSKGFFYIKGLIDIAKTKDSGFLKWYFFKKEGDKVDFPKLGYVKAIKEWNWFIGTGDYIDDIDNQVIQAVSLPIILSILIYIAIVIISLMTIAKSIIKPIEDMADISDQLANNDFTIAIEEDKNNTEIGKLNRSFKRLVLNFRNMISQANLTATKLLSESEMVNSQVQQSIEGSRQIVESLNQLAAGSEQVSNSVEKGLSNTNNINKAIQGIYSDAQVIEKLGNETESSAIKGREQVNKAVSEIENIKHTSVTTSSTIKELGELSSKIEQIVDLIKSIAGQTNLLALNAAIEAARAGEHGKGFAVVADEVKKLATQSGSASDKITEMIKEIQHKTKLAVDNMDRGAKEVDEGVIVIKDTGIALENIVNQIKQANYKIQSVTKEIDNVAKNSDKVVLMTENIATITEETAASTEEIASITEEQSASLDEVHASFESLDEVAKNLQKLISQFKV